MDVFLFFALTLLLPVALVGGLSYAIYRVAKVRLTNPRRRYLAVLPGLVLLMLLYFSIYPSDDFFRDDYLEVTGTEAPTHAEFITTSATFPDHFGDYTSVAVVRIGPEAYGDLKHQLQAANWEDDAPLHQSSLSAAARLALTDTALVMRLVRPTPSDDPMSRSSYYFTGFRADGETVVVERSSW